MKKLVDLIENSFSKYSGEYLIDTRRNKVLTYESLHKRVKLQAEQFFNYELIVLKLDNREEFLICFIASIISERNVLVVSPDESEDLTFLKIKKLQLKYIIINNGFDFGNTLSKREKIDILNPYVYVSTSATTGESKLVPQSYENIASNIMAISKHHSLNGDKTVGSALPLFHVNALYFSFLATFISGSRYVMLDPINILMHAKWCDDYRVNIVSTIPVLINQYLRYSEKISFNKNTINYFVSAAAPLSGYTLNEFIAKYGIRINQGYGLSEAINFSCTIPFDISEENYNRAMFSCKIPSIGTALSDNEVEVLIDNNKIGEEEEVGEIILRGCNVFDGYFLEKKSEVFWEDWFKTGDLGFYKIIDGKKYFYINGRKKEVAKINSASISLRDVDEYWMSILSDTKDFFSSSAKNDYTGEILVVVILVSSTETLKKEFIDEVKTRLMNLSEMKYRPSVVLFVDESIKIRTASGKAKRWMFENRLKVFEKLKPSRDIKIVIAK